MAAAAVAAVHRPRVVAAVVVADVAVVVVVAAVVIAHRRTLSPLRAQVSDLDGTTVDPHGVRLAVLDNDIVTGRIGERT